MKRNVMKAVGGVVLALFFLVCLFVPPGVAAPKAADNGDLKRLVANLHWLGHDAFRIDADGLVIYIDPFLLKTGVPKADLILITHEHMDHNNPGDVAKIKKDDTIIVTAARGAEKLSGDIQIIKPGEDMTVRGIPIRAVPAYNTNKFRSPGVPFHPRELGYVGYLITVGGVTIYHTGDSDFIPEMKGLKPDVALLPVSGKYVMTAEEAVAAAAAINPRLAVPMHVGGPVGSMSAAEDFRVRATVPVMVLPLEK